MWKHPEINTRQKEFFLEKGYLHIADAIPKSLLEKWQNQLTVLDHSSFNLSDPFVASSLCFLDPLEKSTISRINNLLGHYPNDVLELMSLPIIMKIAEAICGQDAIPMQCDALFKTRHPNSLVLWHQDAIFPRRNPYINIGIYLDDANHEDGCLRLMPGTQHQKQDIKSMNHKEANIIEVPAKAGDIIIHDLMTVHCSQLKKQAGNRRTIYQEWWSASAALEQGHLSNNWIEQLKKWKELLVHRAKGDMKQEMAQLHETEVIKQILELRESPMPSNYGY